YFSIFALLFASWIADFSRYSLRISWFSSKASSFMAWSIFAHRSDGIPISTGITASVPYWTMDLTVIALPYDVPSAVVHCWPVVP
ncbi:hypothetical protein Tco_0424495, partial [Tanacetum coccineum]